MKDKPSTSHKDSALMNRVPGTGRPTRDMHCTNCGRSGHTASHCWGKDINGRRPTPSSSYKSRKNQDRKPAAFVSNDREEKPPVTFEGDEVYTCLMTRIEQSKVQSHSASWLVYSACTAHMTFDRSQFPDYKPMQEAVGVEMDTKTKTRVAGCGDVVLTLDFNGQSRPCKLKDVLHVPEFGYSLLSVSKMTANGVKFEFERVICEVKHNSNTVETAKLVDKLYVLDLARQTESDHGRFSANLARASCPRTLTGYCLHGTQQRGKWNQPLEI